MSATDTESASDIQLRLAEDRTDLARQRTLLAEERTYSAWARTGLAAAAAGFGIAELMDHNGPGWMASTLGILFLISAAAMFVLGFLGYRNALRRSKQAVPGSVPIWVIAALSLFLLVGSALGLVIVVIG